MPDDLLRLDGLSKSFGQVVVADALDLRLAPGETLGIVGPNGAGKSSLFAMISGDLAPDSGRVVFDGEDVTRVPPHQRARAGMGRTYQIPRPFEGMTVFENVLVSATGAAGLRGRAAADAAADTLERAGLLAVANTRGGALTLLQRKRLEVARAMAASPKVLLLDEVAGGLTDPEVVELVELVRAVNATGVAIVWIEHVVHALTATVDRLACLAGGRLVADGEPSAVLADPTVRELYLGHALTVEGDVA
ncbi:ABC transporter ATP-binding protein [Mumia sp. DW29H23]|uniref:ABC transporter ATP-binding protein n=1 Tax=Mumia sp. DW29H23 TaxID=3421241 RepID=UPI003D687695